MALFGERKIQAYKSKELALRIAYREGVGKVNVFQVLFPQEQELYGEVIQKFRHLKSEIARLCE